ncbi:diphosphomevalonate decarboxylase [bacterium]|nr:diphosphomevalonate decarboxylase [bacterium]
MTTVTTRAHPNIAFIKYWGNQDEELRLPANPSLSMNLDSLYTETSLSWGAGPCDVLILNGQRTEGAALQRLSQHLDQLRTRLGIKDYAYVESINTFPTGAGIASSASAFAALTLAATQAAGLSLDERELSTLARLGSGSASRSVPSGFVEWHVGNTHEDSFAETFVERNHWTLVDVVAVISGEHKAVTSRAGHISAGTSDLQAARVQGAVSRLQMVKQSILDRDFRQFAEVVELDSNLMHAVMMTSKPPLFYWHPASLALMQQVRAWRSEGINVCYTLDAGPNVHCICTEDSLGPLMERLALLDSVQETFVARPGAGAEIINVV